ncbi:hypothetical protein BgiBS90_038335 [Biomphalaria glabrata]|nr:hypothetical protein BgiBS90_038335 [Biomphalaria glabrata]
MATHSFSWILWAVKTPSPGHMATHSSSSISWAVKTSVNRAIWPHILFPGYYGQSDSVNGPSGHSFYFLDIKSSQDSFISRTVYGTQSLFSISWVVNTPSPGHMAITILLFRDHGYQYSVTGPYATLSPFPRSWVVNTPSPGHMATYSPFWVSWAVKTSVSGPYATHSPSWISWAVKTPSPVHMATYSPFPISGHS